MPTENTIQGSWTTHAGTSVDLVVHIITICSTWLNYLLLFAWAQSAQAVQIITYTDNPDMEHQLLSTSQSDSCVRTHTHTHFCSDTSNGTLTGSTIYIYIATHHICVHCTRKILFVTSWNYLATTITSLNFSGKISLAKNEIPSNEDLRLVCPTVRLQQT